MKRYSTVILLAVAIIIFDFINVKFNDSRPMIAIKTEKKEQQMNIYNAILYRTIECTSEENHYVTVDYFYRIKDDFCPKKYKIQTYDEYYINDNNVKIENQTFERLKEFYSIGEINNMTEEDVKNATDYINRFIPVSNK